MIILVEESTVMLFCPASLETVVSGSTRVPSHLKRVEAVTTQGLPQVGRRVHVALVGILLASEEVLILAIDHGILLHAWNSQWVVLLWDTPYRLRARAVLVLIGTMVLRLRGIVEV